MGDDGNAEYAVVATVVVLEAVCLVATSRCCVVGVAVVLAGAVAMPWRQRCGW